MGTLSTTLVERAKSGISNGEAVEIRLFVIEGEVKGIVVNTFIDVGILIFQLKIVVDSSVVVSGGSCSREGENVK